MHPEQPSDPPLRHARLDGHPVSWVEGGASDGPCLVMVHGLPGSHRDFRWFAPPFEQRGFRVIRLDMPGFADSAVGSVDPRLPALGDHILRRLDLLGIERAILFGHSIGGPQAMLAASRDHGDRVRGLALIASIGLRPHRSLRQFRGLRWLDLGLRTPLLRGPLGRVTHSEMVKAGFSARTSRGEVRRTIAILRRIDFDSIRAGLSRLSVPTAIAACSNDPFIEASITDELIAACPPGPRLRYAEGGHNPQKFQACEIAEALAPWARGLLDGTDEVDAREA